MNVRSEVVGRLGVCMLCVGDIEDRESGVGVCVNVTKLSETLWIVGLVTIDRRTRRI